MELVYWWVWPTPGNTPDLPAQERERERERVQGVFLDLGGREGDLSGDIGRNLNWRDVRDGRGRGRPLAKGHPIGFKGRSDEKWSDGHTRFDREGGREGKTLQSVIIIH